MSGPKTSTRIAMKILVKYDELLEVRVGEALVVAVAHTTTISAKCEQ